MPHDNKILSTFAKLSPSLQVKVQWTEQLVAQQRQKTEKIRKETDLQLPLLEDWGVEEGVEEVQTFLRRKEKQYEERRARVQGRAVNGTSGQIKVTGEGPLGL